MQPNYPPGSTSEYRHDVSSRGKRFITSTIIKHPIKQRQMMRNVTIRFLRKSFILEVTFWLTLITILIKLRGFRMAKKNTLAFDKHSKYGRMYLLSLFKIDFKIVFHFSNSFYFSVSEC